MRAWGWSQHELWHGACAASRRIGSHTQLELREMSDGGVVKPWVNFILRFSSPTKRLTREHSNGATYPPGVMVRPSYKDKLVLDPIPASDVGIAFHKHRTETVRFQRSCGAPCWHAFGHFFRCLFENNPEGKIKTGLAVYRGMDGFEKSYRATNIEKGSPIMPLQYSEACDCAFYGVDSF